LRRPDDATFEAHVQHTLDFNCDLGEGCGDDAAIIPWLSSASIACGGHAGDADTMRATIAACVRHGVAIGAHPSLPDREHFGRRDLPVTPEQTRAFVRAQVDALAAIAATQGARLHHVKPHGALYNRAARDRAIADAIAAAVRDCDPALWLVGLSGSALTDAGAAAGLRVAHEAFVERRYEADGTLTPRSHPDAVIADLDESLRQVRDLLRGAVVARTGERVPVRVDTLCLHGDRPDAAAFATALHAALVADGVRIRAFGSAP
jgi:UPF0271 protein